MSLETIYDVLTSLEKVGQVMDMELEKSDGYVLEKSPDGNGIHIETQELSFRYPESKREVLKNLSVEIKNKESVLISGTNGSGKSTFIHLLAALYDINDGSILLNGMDQSSYDRNSLRRNIGGCLSEGEIFEGTLFENISMNREGIGLQEVEWSLQKVGLNKWIKTLPLGYYNPLDPLGNRLSRSIIQRLLIARAIVDKPCLLLIEYAMDSIDFEDRKEIVDFILDKSNPWTLITVSNDEYLAKNVDKIILMNDGQVEHIGKYEMLKNFFKFKKRDDV
jgi:ABC-type bacteriocin/lantibiotic exporter with double-glycine peptidase domain